MASLMARFSIADCISAHRRIRGVCQDDFVRGQHVHVIGRHQGAGGDHGGEGFTLNFLAAVKATITGRKVKPVQETELRMRKVPLAVSIQPMAAKEMSLQHAAGGQWVEGRAKMLEMMSIRWFTIPGGRRPRRFRRSAPVLLPDRHPRRRLPITTCS